MSTDLDRIEEIVLLSPSFDPANLLVQALHPVRVHQGAAAAATATAAAAGFICYVTLQQLHGCAMQGKPADAGSKTCVQYNTT